MSLKFVHKKTNKNSSLVPKKRKASSGIKLTRTLAPLSVGSLLLLGTSLVHAGDVLVPTGEVSMTSGQMLDTSSPVDVSIENPDLFAEAVRDAAETAREDAIDDFLAQYNADNDPDITRNEAKDLIPQSQVDAAVNGAITPIISSYTTGDGADTATCAQQLDAAITGLEGTSNGLSLGGDIANLVGNVALIPPADAIAGIVGDSLSVAADAVDIATTATSGVQNGLPNCNARFTGTIKGDANIIAKQGITAFDGAITLGNDGSISYQEGISLGGGNLSGAGFGGLDAETGDKDAVAIGNGSKAEKANDTAIGTNAHAKGGNSTAVGANSKAFGENSSALGAEAEALEKNSTAVGYKAKAEKENDTALGANSNALGGDSTAIGSNSNAEGLKSTALGFQATASKENDTALGAHAVASGLNSTAVGDRANATGLNSLAIGSVSIAGGENDVAVGTNNKTGVDGNNSILGNGNQIISGKNNVAIGVGHTITGDQNTAIGDPITIDGQKNFIAGNNSIVVGDDNIVVGNENDVGAVGTPISNNLIVGDNNDNINTDSNNIVGDSNTVNIGTGNNIFGDNSTIHGTRSLAIGQEVAVLDSGAIGIGAGVRVSDGAEGAIATGRDSSIGTNSKRSVVYGDNSSVADNSPDSTVIGSNSKGNAEDTTVVGSNAEANARGAAAFGRGAVATLTDQQVFGTSSNTYKTPGITSDKSRSRQVGRLQLTTTDAYGNLASDQGSTFRAIANLQAGVAIALAAKAPSLPGDKNFGFRLGYGNFDGEATGIAASAIGVLCRDCFTQGDRLTLDASFGVGWAEFQSYQSDEVVSGQIGISWVW
ncbi:MAG: hypothetical protein ACRBBJ_07325 [Rhodomicrobiaceae bacterium]